MLPAGRCAEANALAHLAGVGDMSKALAILKREFLEILPPTTFFLVVFYVVVLTRSLMGETVEISMDTYLAATVAALVVGKAVLIADALPLFRWFSRRPLVFNVAWRSLLYLSAVLLLQLLEELIPLIREHGRVAAAIGALVAETDWTRFWATHLLFVLFVVCYCLGTAMIGVIGRERFLETFLGWKRGPESAPPVRD
jgi:hypothetical protein